MTILHKTPLAASGLALGLAGLGTLLKPTSEIAWATFGALSLTVVFLIVVRLVLDPKATLDEAFTPVVHSTLPAFFMAVTLLSTYLAPIAPAVGAAIWWGALLVQVAVSAWFIVRYTPGLELKAVLPSWFLVAVGFVVSAVTSPAFSLQSVGQVLVWIGIAGYAATLPLVVARLVKVGPLPTPAAPLIAITTAPPALLIAGYLSTHATPQTWIVATLLIAWALSFAFVLTQAPGLLRLGFLPSMGALTFPVVISATALAKANVLFAGEGLLGQSIELLAPIVLGLAVTDVVYVSIRYALYLRELARG